MNVKRKLSDTQIKERFTSGVTQGAIAADAGVSRERIRQILEKLGLRRCDGGAWLRATIREERRALRLADRYRLLWGISRSEGKDIRHAFGYAPFRAFLQQRKNATARGIQFLFTFGAWWAIWQESGHWNERGIVNGRHLYVMSRVGDTGPYSPDNVRIVTQSENMIEHGQIKRGDKKMEKCKLLREAIEA